MKQLLSKSADWSRWYIMCLLIVFSILTQSCATIISGSRSTLYVKRGSPAQADIYYNNKYMGQAPLRMIIDRKCKRQDCDIQLLKENYRPKQLYLKKKLRAGYVLPYVAGALIFAPLVVSSLLVDLAAGSIYRSGPRKLNYTLEPDSKPERDSILTLTNITSAAQHDLSISDLVIFSSSRYREKKGEVLELRRDGALIKFKRKTHLGERISGLVEVEDEIEVPYAQITKRQLPFWYKQSANGQ